VPALPSQRAIYLYPRLIPPCFLTDSSFRQPPAELMRQQTRNAQELPTGLYKTQNTSPAFRLDPKTRHKQPSGPLPASSYHCLIQWCAAHPLTHSPNYALTHPLPPLPYLALPCPALARLLISSKHKTIRPSRASRYYLYSISSHCRTYHRVLRTLRIRRERCLVTVLLHAGLLFVGRFHFNYFHHSDTSRRVKALLVLNEPPNLGPESLPFEASIASIRRCLEAVSP
jgi:hypothetical protein